MSVVLQSLRKQLEWPLSVFACVDYRFNVEGFSNAEIPSGLKTRQVLKRDARKGCWTSDLGLKKSSYNT